MKLSIREKRIEEPGNKVRVLIQAYDKKGRRVIPGHTKHITIHETSVGEVHEVIIKALKEQEKGE